MKISISLSAATLCAALCIAAPAQAALAANSGACSNIDRLRTLSDSTATITAGVFAEGGVLSRESIRAARDSARIAARDSGLSEGGVSGFASQIAFAVVEIGDAMLAGDWLAARALASDPEFKAGAEAVHGYVNSRCSDAAGGASEGAAESDAGGAPPVRSLNGAKGIGDTSRAFAGQSAPVQFAGLLAVIAALMLVAHGLRFTYDVVFAMIFRRTSCFIPCTLTFDRPDAEPIAGRITILDQRGVGFEPNLLSDATFVAGAEFYEQCRVRIGKSEYSLRLLLYYPERMAFDFESPLTLAQHRGLLGRTMVAPSLSVRPPIDKDKARHVMENRKQTATTRPLGERRFGPLVPAAAKPAAV